MSAILRTYKREELEFFAQRFEKGWKFPWNIQAPWTAEDVKAELKRRDDLAEKALDTVKYPELSPSFR